MEMDRCPVLRPIPCPKRFGGVDAVKKMDEHIMRDHGMVPPLRHPLPINWPKEVRIKT